jgi:hypothetical protein
MRWCSTVATRGTRAVDLAFIRCLHPTGRRGRAWQLESRAGSFGYSSGEGCTRVGGVSPHANVAVPARDRRRLERLCRYVARPPVETERFSRVADGRLLCGARGS